MIKVNTSELLEMLNVLPTNQNLLLVGTHGIGKSEIIKDFYSKKGYKVVVLMLGQMSDTGDIIGLPYKDEKTGRTDFMPPYWFSSEGQPIALFLDEINRARPEMLQAIMQLTLERTINGKSLPSNSIVVGACNYGENYQLTDLDPALVSRFNVVEFEPDVSEWLLWADKNGIDKRVITFISQNPDFLDGLQFRKEEMGLEKSPDRRGWVRISDIIKNISNPLSDVSKKIYASIIGTAAGTNFVASLNENRVLTAQEILECNNFDDYKNVLIKYTTPDLAIINESIFRCLETKTYNVDKVNNVIKNIQSYFGLLILEMQQEALGHFTSIYISPTYSNAVGFIASRVPKLEEKILKFIESIDVK